MFRKPPPASAPAINIRESPGRYGRNTQACLAKNDGKEDQVGPDTVSLYNSREVFVEVDNEVKESEQNHFSLVWIWQRINEFLCMFNRYFPRNYDFWDNAFPI